MDLVIVAMAGAAEECRKTGGMEIGLRGWLADPGDVEEGESAEDEEDGGVGVGAVRLVKAWSLAGAGLISERIGLVEEWVVVRLSEAGVE